MMMTMAIRSVPRVRHLHIEQPAALPAGQGAELTEADDEEAAGEEHRGARDEEEEPRHLPRMAGVRRGCVTADVKACVTWM